LYAQAGDPPTDPPPDPPTGSSEQGEERQDGAQEGIQDEAQAGPPTLDPVRVTARRWWEYAQDVPSSVTVVDSETLRDAHVSDVREASQYVPNLFITEFSSRRLSFPTLRGISTGVGEPSVVTYIDGVPQLRVSSTNISLLDVERIEFLRGPQGSLFGRNAIGGVINIETERPGDAPSLDLNAMVGTYQLQEYDFSASTPVVDDELFISLSGQYAQRDGYTTNSFSDTRVDDRRSLFGRGRVLWTPDDENEFEYTAYYEQDRDGAFVLGDLDALEDNPFVIAQDFDGSADRDILSNAVRYGHSGEHLKVDSVTSFLTWEIDEEADFDFSTIDGVRRFTMEEEDYFYHETRFSSAEDAPIRLGERATLKWLAGGTFFAAERDESAANEFRPGGAGILFAPSMVGTSTDRGEFSSLGFSLFGQAAVEIDERLELAAGLRYDYEDVEVDRLSTFETGGFTVFSSSSSPSDQFDELSPTFSASYEVVDDVRIYGRAAKGFKAGGFNLASPSGFESFGTETSWSYEAGIKTTLLDDRLLLNASYFYIDWDDLQVSLFDAMAGGYIANAAEATSQGFELEAAAQVTDGLNVFASFGYTDAQYDSFVNQFGQDVSGNDIAFVPETTINVGAQYNGEIDDNSEWFIRSEFTRIGTYNLDSGNMRSDDYSLLNFQGGVRFGRVRVSGFIRNTLDEEYIQVAFQPSPVDPTAFVGENGPPQTVGVSVQISF
jgi:iron complex outermembrane receptor protein